MKTRKNILEDLRIALSVELEGSIEEFEKYNKIWHQMEWTDAIKEYEKTRIEKIEELRNSISLIDLWIKEIGR